MGNFRKKKSPKSVRLGKKRGGLVLGFFGRCTVREEYFFGDFVVFGEFWGGRAELRGPRYTKIGRSGVMIPSLEF